MDADLDFLAAKIGLNTQEAYLSTEYNQGILKILVVERGAGGCTFPQMETLGELPLDNISLFSSLLQGDALLQEIFSIKAKIRYENPYFYDTVFFDKFIP